MKTATKTKSFSMQARTDSFRYAINGLKTLFKTEANAFIQLGIALTVVVMGLWLHLSASEWITVVFAMGIVFAAELFNSAIEYLSDVVSPGFDSRIKKVKDLAAAGVLVASIAAFITGLIIFVPKIISLL
jgi:diacylglycerol kinase